MTFLHWSCSPETVQALLPGGMEVDTFERQAWISLTPFLMEDFRLSSLPPVRGISTFPETNLRTYVRGPDGRDGLWFLSLEADSLTTVLGASTVYGVPYRWAEMSVQRGETVQYRSRRRSGGTAGHDITVRPGGRRSSQTALDDWLTGRWRAFSSLAGRLVVIPVEHEPWPLHDVEVVVLEQSLFEAVGLPAPDGEPLAQFSPGVSVRLGPPRPA